MPRPQKSRRICCYPDYWSFAPDQDKANDTIIMSLDEFETIRLLDYQSKTQEQCASEMNVASDTLLKEIWSWLLPAPLSYTKIQ